MKIVKLPQAFIDLVETADYLAEEDISVADRFFDAFELTLEDLRRFSALSTPLVTISGS